MARILEIPILLYNGSLNFEGRIKIRAETGTLRLFFKCGKRLHTADLHGTYSRLHVAKWLYNYIYSHRRSMVVPEYSIVVTGHSIVLPGHSETE
jgi:hypothetical protein